MTLWLLWMYAIKTTPQAAGNRTRRDLNGNAMMHYLFLLISFCLLACDKTPEQQEWSVADHKGVSNTSKDLSRQNLAGRTKPEASSSSVVADVLWQQNCASCHGQDGQGDRQKEAGNAPDFTQSSWQTSITDESIVSTIRQGKGRMPKFSLDSNALVALVQKIRVFRRN